MKFWQFRNESATVAELLLYGEISDVSWWGDEVTPKQFATDLMGLGAVEEIKVRINSPGGDVFAGQTIYSLLKAHTAKITTYADGLVASIASVIFMAGDTRVMQHGAMMMVHDPAVYARGAFTEAELRSLADALAATRASLLTVYEARTGRSTDELTAMLTAETWLTADQAVEQGFADQVDSFVVQASLRGRVLMLNNVAHDLSRFSHIPAALLPHADQPPAEAPELNEIRALTRELTTLIRGNTNE